MGFDSVDYSPSLLKKISWAGGNCNSYQQAETVLAEIGDIFISYRQIARITDKIGKELLSVRDHSQLVDQTVVPKNPPAAVVSVDGGRVQTRAENDLPGVHNPQWKADNIAHLQIMEADSHEVDPHPEVPTVFIDKDSVRALVTGLAGHAKATEKEKVNNTVSLPPQPHTHKKDTILLKSCVVSMLDAKGFAPLVRNEAERLNLNAAPKKLFISDGGTGNWLVYEMFFSHWLALLDFVHLVEHLFAVAQATVKSQEQAWLFYVTLITHAWKGEVVPILNLLSQKQTEIGLPPKQASDSDPRIILRRAIHYINENASRMDYPRIRKLGLPVSSCRVESLIKQVNQRVKASDKFWTENKVEAVMQIRAAELSTTKRWDTFWDKRMLFLAEANRVFLRNAA